MRALRPLLPFALALAAIGLPSASVAQIAVAITVAPPALPVYVQPAIPAPGYIWTPGYWAYGPDGYYWVPGTWVLPPAVGLLWTPGYWGWRDRVYVWNAGYWGPHVGYYGGINYGFGYVGAGYAGGYWNGGVLTYNRTVNNFGGVTVVNTYDKTVVNNTTVNQVSFNGPGGANAQPTPQELAAAREQHTPATALQTQHAQAASTNRLLLASVNHGNPGIAATPKAGTFAGPGVVGSKATVGPGNNPAATGSIKGPNTPGGNSPAGPTPNGPTNGPANSHSINTVTNQTTNGPASNSPINGTPKEKGTPVSTLTPSNKSDFNPPPARGPGLAGPPPGGPRKPPQPKKSQKP